ncbi:hypothetical protein GW17_00057190, partial [Ensete ventricosum]
MRLNWSRSFGGSFLLPRGEGYERGMASRGGPQPGPRVGGSIDDVGASLKKRSKKAAPEEPVDASGGTTKVPIGKGREPTGKGKEPVEVEEVHPGFMRGGGLGRGGQ